ncbi:MULTISPECIES: Phenylacetic acid catabolic protein [Phaeobacter]|uniref:Phenylacetic acid catabolic protein n=1 Tax=Phaeobacter TaxID=302485 RepID=UPI000C9D258D|nr:MULTISPECIES: Phenylacetic acid catabolic protein [Phaeobacter]AUQ53077.1 phenylacetic acid degradation protein paaA-like protein [Phaeobacter inhibens]AUQ69296.1 phenylacetic acid degradation protein paaA-like protein [Phaeobacter inhibens]AUQ77094.1 phenylacetic acid degradation protein paaA-like protein [Phaeobacter inhibens]AUR14253.1 phenylacetic acid degradation protein paaA-like protein [Phaeobacter inhibens]MBQ4808442.1 phenylacetate-CoA oxygenase subunit PaaI [Phaeobacter sp. HS012
MNDEMSIEGYLAAGGVLSNPSNVPPRYRAELMTIMASFVDSALAGAAGFVDIINEGPGIKSRMAAARIVLEKTANADRVLQVMGDFGADTERYVDHHPWTARLDRDAGLDQSRSKHDRRLAVFNYPLEGWADAVVMNLLMGRAVAVQLAELSMISYQPLAEAFRSIQPVEAHHARLAHEGLARLVQEGDISMLTESIHYWWPRVAISFGTDASDKFETLSALGLRHRSNSDLRTRWQSEMRGVLRELGLDAPEPA